MTHSYSNKQKAQIVPNRSITLRDTFIALLLLAASFTVLGVAQTNQGIVRDEATYFNAAEDYWGWLSGLA